MEKDINKLINIIYKYRQDIMHQETTDYEVGFCAGLLKAISLIEETCNCFDEKK